MLTTSSENVKAKNIAYKLRSDKLNCVKNNIDKYLASFSGDVILIAVADCPKISKNPIFDALKNEMPDIKSSPNTVTDSFIMLTRDQLECLADLTIDIKQPVYMFYPETCNLEATE
jgi:hypothetical protein